MLKMMDLKNIESQRKDLLFRGAMGTTGSKFNTPPFGVYAIRQLSTINYPIILVLRTPNTEHPQGWLT
jgi:hypothetical protein